MTTFLQTIRQHKASESQRQEALHLAEKFEAKLRRQVMQAFSEMRGGIDEDELIAAVKRGRAYVEDLFASSRFTAAFGKVTDSMNAAFNAAGIEQATLAASGELGLAIVARWDMANPYAAAAMRQNNLELITAITRQQRRSISAILINAVEAQQTPFAAARDIRDTIGLTARDAQAVRNYRAFIEAGQFGQARRRDIGGNADRTLNAASGGRINLDADRVDRLVASYADRLLRNRAGTIAATESFRSYNQGHAEGWRQIMEQNPEIEASRFKRFWIATRDERTRPDHLALPQINSKGVAMDKPFALPLGGTIRFPHDPQAPASETINCRCTLAVRLVDDYLDRFFDNRDAGRSVL